MSKEEFLSAGHPALKGMLDIWMLTLLNKQDMNGYELSKKINDATGHLWQPKTGSIYPALHKLEKNGLIKSKKAGARGQIVYSLTGEGKAAVASLRKKIYSHETRHKFRNMFESLVWPRESDELKKEIETLHEAVFKLRDSRLSEKEKTKKLKSAILSLR